MSRLHEDWFDGYMEFVEDTEPPVLFKKWSALSTIAGALQRKCFMVWEDLIYPNIYVAICGPSGNRKSTAISNVRKFLRQLEVPLASDSVSREGLIKIFTDSEGTIEDCPELLEKKHSSVTVISSELAVFLGVNQPQFLSALTDWYDCQSPWTYSTRSRGDESIKGIWLNLIGGITPMMVNECLPRTAVGGGLTSRMIFVYGEGRSKLVSRPTYTTDALESAEKLVMDLHEIHGWQGQFNFTQEYEDRYADWYVESYKNPPAHLKTNFTAYLERRPMHVRKLSMLFNASRDGEMLLDVEDFERALDLMVETELDMPKVFGMYGQLDQAEVLHRIIEIVTKEKEISLGKLFGEVYMDVTKDTLMELLHSLSSIDPPVLKLFNDEKGKIHIRYVGEQKE